jgi:hypothetical protein
MFYCVVMSISPVSSRRPTRRRIALAVVLFVVGGAMIATLFDTAGPSNGPVHLQAGDTTCMDSKASRVVLMGVDISNSGSSSATLASFTPASVEGVSVEHVWFYDPKHGGKVGEGIGATGYPHTGLPNWKYRTAVAGSTIPTGHDVFLAVLLRLKPGQTTGQVKGGFIRYTVNGFPYSSGGNFAIGFTDHGLGASLNCT